MGLKRSGSWTIDRFQFIYPLPLQTQTFWPARLGIQSTEHRVCRRYPAEAHATLLNSLITPLRHRSSVPLQIAKYKCITQHRPPRPAILIRPLRFGRGTPHPHFEARLIPPHFHLKSPCTSYALVAQALRSLAQKSTPYKHAHVSGPTSLGTPAPTCDDHAIAPWTCEVKAGDVLRLLEGRRPGGEASVREG